MTVSGMLYVCWLRRMASGPPHSNIYMTERTGFPLIRLHHMNLPLNVRIGKTLLHLERVLVYIALQGGVGVFDEKSYYTAQRQCLRDAFNNLQDILFGAFLQTVVTD